MAGDEEPSSESVWTAEEHAGETAEYMTTVDRATSTYLDLVRAHRYEETVGGASALADA